MSGVILGSHGFADEGISVPPRYFRPLRLKGVALDQWKGSLLLVED